MLYPNFDHFYPKNVHHTVQNWTYNPKQIWHYFEAIRDSFMIRVNGNYGKNRYSMGYF